MSEMPSDSTMAFHFVFFIAAVAKRRIMSSRHAIIKGVWLPLKSSVVSGFYRYAVGKRLLWQKITRSLYKHFH